MPSALRALALYQRLLLVLVLIQLVPIAGLIAVLNFEGDVDLFILCFAALWAVGFAVGLVAFQIGHTLYGWYGGLALGGLALLWVPFLPGLGVVAVLLVNVLLNRAFRRHGIRVGLLGANRVDLARLDGSLTGSQAEEDER